MNLQSIDREIADTTARRDKAQAQLGKLKWPDIGGAEGSALYAAIAGFDKRVGQLKERRVAVEAGVTDDFIGDRTEFAALDKRLAKIEAALAPKPARDLPASVKKIIEDEPDGMIAGQYKAIGAAGLMRAPARHEVYRVVEILNRSGQKAFDSVTTTVEGLEGALATLGRRIDELEQRGYCGVHEDGKEYRRGQMVTRSGSIWHCEAATTKQRPGDNRDWTLAVKAGRDAR